MIEFAFTKIECCTFTFPSTSNEKLGCFVPIPTFFPTCKSSVIFTLLLTSTLPKNFALSIICVFPDIIRFL